MKKELDPFELWQLKVYGNIIESGKTLPDAELYEAGIEELDRLAEWINMQAEK